MWRLKRLFGTVKILAKETPLESHYKSLEPRKNLDPTMIFLNYPMKLWKPIKVKFDNICIHCKEQLKTRLHLIFLETLNKIKVSLAEASEATPIPGHPRQMLRIQLYKVCILNSFSSNKGVRNRNKKGSIRPWTKNMSK